MPMSHKAYAFDWVSFDRDELAGLLSRALETGNTAGLVAYIERNRPALRDPYEGDPLDDDWQNLVEHRDAHGYGDFALTRFYDPAADSGLGDCWNDSDDTLPEEGRLALLGSPFGPAHNCFDPGRYGSYFQTPQRVARSLALVRGFDLPWLNESDRHLLGQFERLLGECVARGMGLYVTF